MGQITFIATPTFPIGTTVYAYRGQVPAYGHEPAGGHVASAVVSSAGQLTFTGLDVEQHVASAVVSSVRRYMSFVPRGGDSDVSESDLPYVYVTDSDFGASIAADADWNTGAIQSAIDSLDDIGGTVVLNEVHPTRAYEVYGIELPGSVGLLGPGRQVGRLKLADGSPSGAHLISNAGGGSTADLYVRVAHLELDGNKAGNPSGGDGINGYFSQSQFEDLWVKDCNGHGVRLHASGSNSTLNRLLGVYVTNCDTHAAYLSGNADFFISDSWFAAAADSGGAGLKLDSCGNARVNGLLVDTCDYGIDVSNCAGIQVSGFNVGDCEVANVRLKGGNNQIQFINGCLTADASSVGASTDAILLDSDGANTIDQVTFDGVQFWANNVGGGTEQFDYLFVTTGGGTFSRVLLSDFNVGSGAAAQFNPVVLPSGTDNRYVGASRHAFLGSAATMQVPFDVTVAEVTGTTNVTSVLASYQGHRVTLIFQGALTFTDGSNLKLAGSFSTSADDAITLVSNGTNWYEAGRSAN